MNGYLRAFVSCLAGLVLAATLAGCFGAGKQKAVVQPRPDYLDRVDEYVERGRFGAALDLIDDRIKTNPADYEQRLLRATVLTAMKKDAEALAELDAALDVFEKNKRNYPPSEQNQRLAGIHRDYALASLIAERRAQGEDAAKYEALFESHTAETRRLDENAYVKLMSMIGREPKDVDQGAVTPAPTAGRDGQP